MLQGGSCWCPALLLSPGPPTALSHQTSWKNQCCGTCISSAQPLLSLSFLLHAHPDLSTAPAMLQGAKPVGTTPGILPSTPMTHKLHSHQRWGRSFPFSLPCLWAQLLPALLLPAWLPAGLSLSTGVMHRVLTCLDFTHHRVKLCSQPHLSGNNQKQANKGRDGTLQNEKHLYF